MVVGVKRRWAVNSLNNVPRNIGYAEMVILIFECQSITVRTANVKLAAQCLQPAHTECAVSILWQATRYTIAVTGIFIQPHITSLLPLNMGLCTVSPLLREYTGILLTEYSVTSDAGKCSHKMSLFHDRLGLLSCWKCIYVFHEKFALWIFVLEITNTLMTRAYCCVLAHSNTTPVCTHTRLLCVYIYIYTSVRVYIYIHTHTHTHIYIYIYIYI